MKTTFKWSSGTMSLKFQWRKSGCDLLLNYSLTDWSDKKDHWIYYGLVCTKQNKLVWGPLNFCNFARNLDEAKKKLIEICATDTVQETIEICSVVNRASKNKQPKNKQNK